MERFFAKRIGVIWAGMLIAGVLFLLEWFGNPLNMGLCVVSFWGDVAGALRLHDNDAARYLRPEIAGLFWGAFVSALWTGELQPRRGAASLLRLLLGICVAFGAMVFMGDSLRAFLRLAGGDANAVFGVLGLFLGVALGVLFLAKGFSLGDGRALSGKSSLLTPLLFFVLLLLIFFAPFFPDWIASSQKGEGAIHAIPLIGLGGGLLVGALAQRSRFCFIAPMRDALLTREYTFLYGLLAFLLMLFAWNYLLGQFHFGLSNQPLAHSDTLWNVLAMLLVGLALTMIGACPLRQMALAAEGDVGAVLFIGGIVIGAILAHNWGIYSPQGVVLGGKLAVIGGLCFCGIILLVKRRRRAPMAKGMAAKGTQGMPVKGILDARDVAPAQTLRQVKRLLASDVFPITILLGEATALEGIKRLSAQKSLQVKCFHDENLLRIEILAQ